ncbi:flagellar basal body P-ring protein FlgI [Thermospira aquatica]|uniref:Flagellar P-ring protein n=1 Tax=Thermospira aquatica TaxID=2828656 RepID=A0AAX3BBT0_9SPIR|nr:flagellar basal body P-ring protein FlgI [Thermospira aquatica]URA09732.1 flagellar basal body P-ring protein FlgI [Thermospira aquatica]
MKKVVFLLVVSMAWLWAEPVELKYIVSVEGLSFNPLIGYGIVIGLKGTGDSEGGSQTKEFLARIANHFGIQANIEKFKPKNAAVVMVMADVPPFAQTGNRLDVRVASVFDAKSLEGGELVVTPLLGGDNEMYAVASGKLVVDSSSKSVSGTILQGAIVQKPIPQTWLQTDRSVILHLDPNYSFDAMMAVEKMLQRDFSDTEYTLENYTIKIKIPEGEQPSQWLGRLLAKKVDVPQVPSITIDSKTGMVVAGGDVVVTEAAVVYQGSQITIGSGGFSWGGSSSSQKGSAQVLPASTTIQELVTGLNQLGMSAQDVVKILQLLHKNGNIKARLQVL